MSSPSRPDPLELRGLEVRYGAVRAVDGVDLAVREGEIVALLGPSGCGKTTLLRAVAGFEPAHRGEVLIDGEVVESERRHVPPHRRPVGLVFQDYALFPHRTVAANVAYGLGCHPLGIGERRAHAERVRELLAMAGLEGLEKRYPHQLSGGQQQRVALLRSLAPRPRVLLLDEPFSNLDPLRRQEIRTQVAALLRAEGVSAILVTHDRADALALADRVAVMDAGRILQYGTGEEVYLRPATPEVASMLGDVQYIDAHVESGMAATPLGPVRVAGPIQQGAARILARPEWIIPCSGGACVSVVSRQPEGALTRLAVRTADGSTLEMVAPAAWVSHAGDEIAVAITMALPAFEAQGGGAGAAD